MGQQSRACTSGDVHTVSGGGSSTTEGIMERRGEIQDRQRKEQFEAVCSKDSERRQSQ